MNATPLRRALLSSALALVAVVSSVAPASAEDPAFIGWSATLPALATTYDPGSADACVAGRFSCVDKTIRQMTARFDPLAKACHHNAVFSLAYLRTTEAYLKAAKEPGFFKDTPFVNHEDRVFAELYFNAYDAWAAGNRAYVPLAWRVALDDAAAKKVTGSGDLLLGMNAHVNRDLPFVLYAIGLVAPDGSSRKVDHDKVNVFLNRVVQPLLAEESARFDPAMNDMQTPYGVGYTGLMQTLIAWRELAWRNAERLASAPDPAAREKVAAQIEQYALDQAEAIEAQSAYNPPLTSTASRDAYCASHQVR